jgi:cell division protein FtsB
MIARARAILAVAFIVGIVIIATEFPLGQLIRSRASLSAATAQLSELKAQDHALDGQLASLHQDATIAGIAHAEYGLVTKGQKAVVVLPSPGASSGGSAPLSASTVPTSDLVPTDAIVSPSSGGGVSVKRPGFWSRLAQRLEFWKAVP